MPPNNLEIEQALKEFEMKSLKEENNNDFKIDTQSSAISVVDFTIKYSGGLIKDQRQAEYVIISFLLLCLITSLFFIFKSMDKRPVVTERDLLITPPLRAPNQQ
jgi:hypothetical protein